MANAGNYTDATDTDFKGASYNINTGKSLSATGMRNALHTKEKVANKQLYSTDATATLTASSASDSYYPTSKLVGKNLDALSTTISTGLSGKQDKIGAGTADDILTKTTTAGTLGTLTKTTLLETDTTKANDNKIPTEKAVATALANKLSASDLSTLQTDVSGLQIDVSALKTTVSSLSFQKELPIGTILMYDGAGWLDDTTLPGWYACTAANKNLNLTPNLEDKFIKGNGNKAATGDGQMTLGTQHLPAHKHSITDNGHDHKAPNSAAGDGEADTHPYGTYFVYDGTRAGAENSWTTTPSVNSNKTGISETNNNTGGGQAFDVLPSYYSVIYIKKIA
ncbi:MAG: hypothetical protein LBK68_01630 [Candidatus Margulisbacteria bacterium]|nr:hypothetical protein [Candidatus Margulisiibacteriota bacterium]